MVEEARGGRNVLIIWSSTSIKMSRRINSWCVQRHRFHNTRRVKLSRTRNGSMKPTVSRVSHCRCKISSLLFTRCTSQKSYPLQREIYLSRNYRYNIPVVYMIFYRFYRAFSTRINRDTFRNSRVINIIPSSYALYPFQRDTFQR